MAISIQKVDLRVLNMKTRMPFRYGMASLVGLPHLFLRVEADIDGRSEIGIAAEGLPPKWFTKNPDSSFAEDLVEMLPQQALPFLQVVLPYLVFLLLVLWFRQVKVSW